MQKSRYSSNPFQKINRYSTTGSGVINSLVPGWVPPRVNQDPNQGSMGKLEMHVPFANFAGPHTDVKRRMTEHVIGTTPTDIQANQHDIDYYVARSGLRSGSLSVAEAVRLTRTSDEKLIKVAKKDANSLQPLRRFHGTVVGNAMSLKNKLEDANIISPLKYILNEGEIPPGAGKKDPVKKLRKIMKKGNKTKK